jgi:hypothetical protein
MRVLSREVSPASPCPRPVRFDPPWQTAPVSALIPDPSPESPAWPRMQSNRDPPSGIPNIAVATTPDSLDMNEIKDLCAA